MKIKNIQQKNQNNRARIQATVTWEDCDFPSQEIYFETTQDYAHYLSPSPDAFLVGNIMRAMHFGEKRLKIDGEICPELKQNLITAMSLISHWFDSEELVCIEAKTSSQPPNQTSPRAGLFLSGGVDSLAVLRSNRLNFPLEHPQSIKDCIVVYGQDMGRGKNHTRDLGLYKHRLQRLQEIAIDAKVNLIPLYTNFKTISGKKEINGYLNGNKMLGADLAAIGHVLSNQLNIINISSSSHIPYLKPLGCHPLLDIYYSSSNLRVRHEGITLSRFEKTQLLADWNTGLHNIKVCLQPVMKSRSNSDFNKFNCGQCEKCIRTMTALVALAKLKQSRAFLEDDISPELLNKVFIQDEYQKSCYQELITPLKTMGRNDLVNVIQKIIFKYNLKRELGLIKTQPPKKLNCV